MTNTIQNKIEEAKKRFEKKFTYASFTWNGDNATGVKFAKETRRKAKQFLSQELIFMATFAQEEARKEMEYIAEQVQICIELCGEETTKNNLKNNVLKPLQVISNNTLQ